MAAIHLKKTITGSILDIGGGGEGIIGRVYPAQVTAIDIRREELEEAPGDFTRIQMDACRLGFKDESFDHVTAFYCLMYLEKPDHEQVIHEACRVLKPGGQLHIWDADILTADPFLAELDIDAGGLAVHTTYGIYKDDAAQDAIHFKRICTDAGFRPAVEQAADGHFYLRFHKPNPSSLNQGDNMIEELRVIMTRFAASGWDLIAGPSIAWLEGRGEKEALIAAIEQADRECGSCGCEYDPLYKRALKLKDLL